MSIKIDKATKNFLLDFGLNDKEIICYITLLKTGPNTIMNLSRETGIKRSTTHNIVEDLIEKGLVTQTNYGERRMIMAEDPKKLQIILEQRKWEMKKIEDVLPKAIKTIMSIIPQDKIDKHPEVKYFNGIKGFKEVNRKALEKAEEEICLISNPDEWYKIHTEEYDKDYYIPTRLKKNLFLRMLVNSPRFEENLLPIGSDELLKREIRVLPKNLTFKPTITIYKGEISLMTSGEPYIAVVIENNEISEMFLDLFNLLWEISKNT